MEQARDWLDGLTDVSTFGEHIATENFTQMVQGPEGKPLPPFFNPVNITVEEGVYYATFFVCHIAQNVGLQQRVAIWLGGLKETDHVKLTISSTATGIPYEWLTGLMGALANTKGTVEILLNQIVMDGLAYFYLLADKVTALPAGALFVPSYITQRNEDTSGPFRAVHDFYQWIVEDAVVRGRLVQEEADRLFAGSHVIVPVDRF